MTSTATCTLDGHLLIIDTWTSADSTIPDGLTAFATYYAHGSGWTAFVAEQGATATTSTLQMQLTNDAAGLTAQAFNQDAPTPVAAATQKALVAVVARQLHGTVSVTAVS